MEVDSSSIFRQRTYYGKPQEEVEQAQKRSNTSDRATGQRRQRFNNIVQNASQEQDPSYADVAEAAVTQTEEDSEAGFESDSVNFLGNAPGCHSSSGSWVGGQ